MIRQSSLFLIIVLIIIANLKSLSQSYKVVESQPDYLIIQFDFSNKYSVIDTLVDGKTYQKIRGDSYSYRNPGEPWLPDYIVFAGIPFSSNPVITILEQKHTVQKTSLLSLSRKKILPSLIMI